MTSATAKEAEVVNQSYSQRIQNQRAFFNSGITKDIDFRLHSLSMLKQAFLKHQTNLQKALYNDLKKSSEEAYISEIGITIADIDYAIGKLRSWVKPKRQKTPLFFFPGSSWLYPEPYGVSLIISPWNYPIKNLFGPAIGAIAAGNCLVLKPSEIASHTSLAVREMMEEFFDPNYLMVLEGGVQQTTEILQQKFDYIFFTGGTQVGKIIYSAAAKNLTPCTLELGGKSPTIIDKNIHIKIAAKRLAWGKFLNAGQTCVAPDYVLIHKDIKAEFLKEFEQVIGRFFGSDPSKSKDFGRIISQGHYQRIKKLITGNIAIGGKSNDSDRYISPTVLVDVKQEDPVMQEEVFGPVLPFIEYSEIDQAIDWINKGEKPLALYLFTNDSGVEKKVLEHTSSGGVCVNETIMHMVSPHLPFGGVGSSGMGSYNGKFGFDTFSHHKSVMKRSFLFDVPQKYAPMTKAKFSFIQFALKRML